MNSKKILLFLVCCFMIINTNLSAQKFNVTWGDNARFKHDFENAIPLADGQFLVLKLKNVVRTVMGVLKDKPILILVDKNMETVMEKELPLEEKFSRVKGFKQYGNNIFILYESYSQEAKSTAVYALRINEKRLSITEKSTLGVYPSDSYFDQAEPTYKLSADSSKILLFVEGPERKKENKKFFVGVFDTNLQTIWKQEIELPIGDKYISIYDQDITNDAKVFVAIKHYDKEVTRQSVREEGEKVPSYTYKLLVYDAANAKAKEITFNLNNHYIQGTKLSYNKNGTITVAGLYKRKSNGNINGAFYTTFDANTREVKDPKMVPFSSEFITLIDKDNFGTDKGSDPGLYSGFRILHIMNRSNGSVDLISEYYRLRIYKNIDPNAQRNNTYHYTYGDIVNVNISTDGKAVFTRLPKNQRLQDSEIFVGFYPLVYGDKLVLLYNDDKDNVERDIDKKPDDVINFKRSIFMAATIDAKGNLSRQSIYSHLDDDYITIPTSVAKISDTKYMIVSNLYKLLKWRIRFGVMEMK